MGFLDRLLGRDRDRSQQPAWGSSSTTGRSAGSYPPYPPYPSARPGAEPGSDAGADQAAVERYRYLLRTAPPDRIEEAHAEAFAKLSPDQRRMVLSELSAEVPPAERAATDSPRDLARMATRAEMRNPGTLERSFGRSGGAGGIGMGGMLAGGLLAGVAGAFVGTAIAEAMFDGFDGSEFQEGYEAAADDFTEDAGDVGDFGDLDLDF